MIEKAVGWKVKQSQKRRHVQYYDSLSVAHQPGQLQQFFVYTLEYITLQT